MKQNALFADMSRSIQTCAQIGKGSSGSVSTISYKEYLWLCERNPDAKGLELLEKPSLIIALKLSQSTITVVIYLGCILITSLNLFILFMLTLMIDLTNLAMTSMLCTWRSKISQPMVLCGFIILK
jgi:hypothetical protein